MPHTPTSDSSEREQTSGDCRSSRSNITPTPRSHHLQHATFTSNNHSSSQSQPVQIVYIVTDTCYVTPSDFTYNKGTFRIDSVHSSKKNANARAKKIIYDTRQCKVDVDKIIEEMRRGLFTGIGIGGKGEEERGGCYARKCQVERKMVDEDSEDEDGTCEDDEDERDSGDEDEMSGGAAGIYGDEVGDLDGDVQMA